MSGLVVDASVGLKWYLDEPYSETARELLRGFEELCVPHLFFTEIANVLARRQRRGELPERVVIATLAALAQVPLAVWPDRMLLSNAVGVALRHGCSVYDSLYVALADRIEARLITADRRLRNAIAETELARRIVLIEDLNER